MTSNEFTTVLKWFFHLNLNQFGKALEEATGGYAAPYFVQEHWDGMKSNFIYWFCNLDSETQTNFINQALNK